VEFSLVNWHRFSLAGVEKRKELCFMALDKRIGHGILFRSSSWDQVVVSTIRIYTIHTVCTNTLLTRMLVALEYGVHIGINTV